jgi:hypothetical protein
LNNRRADDGTAVALAVGGSALPDNKSFAVSAGFGAYRHGYAVGGNAQVRINEWLVANGGLGIGLRTGSVGGRVGLTAAW